MLRRSYNFFSRGQTLPFDNSAQGGFRDPKVLFGMTKAGGSSTGNKSSRGAQSLFAQKEKEAMDKISSSSAKMAREKEKMSVTVPGGTTIPHVASSPSFTGPSAPKEPRAGGGGGGATRDGGVSTKGGFERTEEMIKNLRKKKGSMMTGYFDTY